MGWFKNSKGNIAGRTDDEGYIYDDKNNYIGRMVGEEIRSKDGFYMGKVESDGRIYDRDGFYSGRVRDDGWVEDKDGHLTHKI